MAPTLFAEVPKGPPDPMFVLKKASDEDTTKDKIDVGIGVYRSHRPGYHEFDAIAKAKSVLQKQPVDHEYNPTTGIQMFVDAASSLVFGLEHSIIKQNRVASVQTVGGTGAVRLGATFLNRNFPHHSTTARSPNTTRVYVGTPAWPNYIPLFEHAGFNVSAFRHYNPVAKSIDIESALETIATAPSQSIFVLQVCCHNPTGQDYSHAQWQQIAKAIQAGSHFVFFDLAYQGFARDMEADAWPVRYFADLNIDMLVCQSFSKHMGLYAERIGALHIVCHSQDIATNVKDQLRSLIRWEVSSTPAYGAKLATIIMHDSGLRALWLSEVQEACDRMLHMRKSLYTLLTEKYHVAGSVSQTESSSSSPSFWDHILHERGLFSYMTLNKSQIQRLRTEHHVYLAESGRINIAGLNEGNIERFAMALKEVFDTDTNENKIGNGHRLDVSGDDDDNANSESSNGDVERISELVSSRL